MNIEKLEKYKDILGDVFTGETPYGNFAKIKPFPEILQNETIFSIYSHFTAVLITFTAVLIIYYIASLTALSKTRRIVALMFFYYVILGHVVLPPYYMFYIHLIMVPSIVAFGVLRWALKLFKIRFEINPKAIYIFLVPSILLLLVDLKSNLEMIGKCYFQKGIDIVVYDSIRDNASPYLSINQMSNYYEKYIPEKDKIKYKKELEAIENDKDLRSFLFRSRLNSKGMVEGAFI